jgi:hypothetical protein
MTTARKVQLRAITSTLSSKSDKNSESANHSIARSSTEGSVADTNTNIYSWEQEAANILLKQMVLATAASDACQGPVTSLPLLYSTANKDSALHCAVLALAVHIYPGSAPTRHEVQSQVWIKYGQALEKVNLALRESSTVQTNEILMTILLFGIIEVSCLTRLIRYEWLISISLHFTHKC